jgi:HlyD family secretion protein
MRLAFRPSLASIALLSAASFAGCGRGDEPDAYGNFEATEVVVSAETSGQLLWFTPDEGQHLEAGALVGIIDTLQLTLERNQVEAQREAGGARAREVVSQMNALKTQQEIAQRSYERTRRLHGAEAATSAQLDQSERDYRVLGDQIEASRAQRLTVQQDIASSAARVAQIEDRIRRSKIANPRRGTVLTSYAEAGEFVQQGQPLYKVADLDSMELRAYITEPQLARVKIGQPVEVSVDNGSDERHTLSGRVTWISAEAEFTPTPVQTREERADLVYALKIQVPNPQGMVKIGMPADVRFTSADSTAQ